MDVVILDEGRGDLLDSIPRAQNENNPFRCQGSGVIALGVIAADICFGY